MKKPELQQVYTEDEFQAACKKHFQQAIANLMKKPAGKENLATIDIEAITFGKNGNAKSKQTVSFQMEDGIHAMSVLMLEQRMIQWKKRKFLPLLICLSGEVWGSPSDAQLTPRDNPERQSKFSFCAMSADGKGSWRVTDFTREDGVVKLGETYDMEPYYTKKFFTPPSVLFSMYAAYNQALSFPGNQTVGRRKLRMQ